MPVETNEPIATVDNQPLVRFAEGVFTATDPVRHLGLHLTATMAVLRLGSGELLLYSPVAMTPQRRAAVAALGPVAHLYAPNTYHHRWIGEWASAFPAARLHAPAGLRKKRSDLRIDRLHGPGAEPEPAFAGCIDELPIAGCRLEESVLVYRPAQTLMVADLVHNLGRPQHRWTAAYARAMGFYDRVALSRMLRWAAFPDQAAARRSVDALLALPFERIIVGHGAPITQAAKQSLAAAYEWLRAAPR